MSVDPWLSIVGMPDDTAAALPPASRAVIDAATVIFGGPRHLELVGAGARGQAWPVPFDVAPVLRVRGQNVVVLASGDPFWFGAGGSLSAHLTAGEWRTFAAPSTFSLIAGALGWRLEEVTCHGLHAAPFAPLRKVLSPRGRLICLLRDGAAPAALARWFAAQGAGDARMVVCERMGGAGQRLREATAARFDLDDVAAPVAVAVELPANVGISRASGLPDEMFHHDGQITKRPIRAMTLSALGPRPGEHLWDLGAGSGSISVEWCLAGGRATAVEAKSARTENIARNIEDFGLSHMMHVTEGRSLEALPGLARPDAVFIGGGADVALMEALFDTLEPGTRIVINGVTLETETLLAHLQAEKGGTLLRIELASAEPLGRMRGWKPARPVVQWSVTL